MISHYFIWHCIAIIYFIECRQYPSMLDYQPKVITMALPSTDTKISIAMEPGISVRSLLSDYCSTMNDSNVCEYLVDMFNAAYYGRYVAPYTDADPFYDMFTMRSDVLVYLQETFHYRSYLEIGCHTNTTFNVVKDMFQLSIGVDPKQGGTHRMTSDAFFSTNHLTFDVIFIDGLHHSEQVAKDIDNALRYLNPGGTIVMHDCNPTTKISQLRIREVHEETFTVDWWRDGTNHWNGDTWRATLPLRLRDDVEIVIGDFDSGVAVIRKRRNTHRLQGQYEEMLLMSPDPLQAFTYEYFDKHRLHLHRLLSFKDLQTWLLLDYSEVMRQQSHMVHMEYFLKNAMDRYNDNADGSSVDVMRLAIISNDDRIQVRMVNTTGHMFESFDIEVHVNQSYPDVILQAYEACSYFVISDDNDVCEDIVKIALLKRYGMQSIAHESSSISVGRYSFCSFIEQKKPTGVLMDTLVVEGTTTIESITSLLSSLYFIARPFDEKLLTIEDSIARTIILSSVKHPSMQRLCIIHSVTTSVASNDNNESGLYAVLSSLESSGLIIDLDMVVVLNYGMIIDESIKRVYGQHVLWLQVYEDEAYFEIPSMRIIHTVAKHFNDHSMEEVQILYLNTELVIRQHATSKQDYVDGTNTSSWNDQLYQLVYRHKSSYHLLSSGEYDCVGLHYHSAFPHHYAENQWWCISSYIAQLSPLPYENTGREESRYWLFTSPEHRIYSLKTLPTDREMFNTSSSISSSSGHSEAFYHCLQIVDPFQ